MNDPRQQQLRKSMNKFEKTSLTKSIQQLCNTFIPLVGLWVAAYFSLSVSYWLTLPLAIAAGMFVVRTFIIFHDCCHGSFFKSKRANDIVGIITGVLTHVPYLQWKNEHAIHHATSSNLDKRGVGDLWIMTVEEYEEASLFEKIQYRLYRNPFVMFVLGPFFVFAFQYRFNRKGARRKEKLNTYLMNVLIVAMYAILILLVGWEAVLLIQLPSFYVAGALGIWLFYVQHQFEDSYFEHDEEWSYVNAAVEGSSYYRLPKLLQWLTGNIGFHHVHHLSPKVPNYLLEQAHNETPPLHKATTIGIKESLHSLKLALWDEQTRRFVSFKEGKSLALRKRYPINEAS
ncbi:fatty acid desaturase [Paenibacillus septentrionalis]|uniref:Fatty acid desaturase n=1 Tax=Paenibacillus septentrionalis TaxID=429342 RepID=A0ABW1V660_9BACL